MREMSSALERLEARVEHQTARIDALFRMLEARGVIPSPAKTGAGDAFFDELVQIEDAPLARERRAGPARRRATRLHVGDSTGV